MDSAQVLIWGRRTWPHRYFVNLFSDFILFYSCGWLSAPYVYSALEAKRATELLELGLVLWAPCGCLELNLGPRKSSQWCSQLGIATALPAILSGDFMENRDLNCESEHLVAPWISFHSQCKQKHWGFKVPWSYMRVKPCWPVLFVMFVEPRTSPCCADPLPPRWHRQLFHVI